LYGIVAVAWLGLSLVDFFSYHGKHPVRAWSTLLLGVAATGVLMWRAWRTARSAGGQATRQPGPRRGAPASSEADRFLQ
jgi:hypothetical protein